VLDVANVNFTGATFTNMKTSGAIATPSSGNLPTFSPGSGYVLYRGFIIGPNVNMSGTNLSTFVFGTNSTAVSQGSTAALSGINFSYANLTSANLLGSTVNDTNFTGSNFFRTRTGGLTYTNLVPTLPNSVIQPILHETNWHYLLSKDGVESNVRWFEGIIYYINLSQNVTHTAGGNINQTMTRTYSSALPQYVVSQPINANTGYWIANYQTEVFHKNSNSFISGTQTLNQYVTWNSQTQIGQLHSNLYYRSIAPYGTTLWSKSYTTPVVSNYGTTVNGTPIEIPAWSGGIYTIIAPRVIWENIDCIPNDGQTAQSVVRSEALINNIWTVQQTWGHINYRYTTNQTGLSLLFWNQLFSTNADGSLPRHTGFRFSLLCYNGIIRQTTAGALTDAGAYSITSEPDYDNQPASFTLLLYGGITSPVVTPYSTTPTLVTLNLPISAPYDISCFNYSSYYVDIIFTQPFGEYSGNIIKLFFNEGSRSTLQTTVAEPLSRVKLISGGLFEYSKLYYSNVPISSYSSLIWRRR